MESILIRAVDWFAQLLLLALFAEAMLSWFVRDLNSPLGRVYNIIMAFTSPLVTPVRRFMSGFNTGGLDWSVFATMILVKIAASLLIKLIVIIF